MSGATFTESQVRPRTGTRVLALLAAPLNVTLLRELEKGPRLSTELHQAAGSPPKRVLRSHLRQLERCGIVADWRRGIRWSSQGYELARPGRELRWVMVSLERWLKGNRWEWIELATDAGSRAIELVLAGWSSELMRAVAGRPRSLAELEDEVRPPSRPSLEEQVEAMLRVGLLETVPGEDGAKPTYVRTAWLCRAMGPIVAASRWERGNLPASSPPIHRVDAETALLLTMPLLQLPPTARGTCRLTVQVAAESGEPPATVTVAADGLRVTACEPVGREADASASGPPSAWFRAAIEAEPGQIAVDGDRRLAKNLLDALYIALYSLRAPQISDWPSTGV